MKLSLFLRSVLAACLTFTLISMAPCRAGGSIGWDDVRKQIAKDDPFLADYIAKNFEMRPSGGAVRVGHDRDGNSLVEGVEVGTRIPPFEFPAKPRGAAGDYTLYLVFEPYGDNKTTLWTLTLRKRLPTD
jgi:hypothetical protein